MPRSTLRLSLLALAVAACGAPARPPAEAPALPPDESVILQAARIALSAAPWDIDTLGWGALCTHNAPCDTLLIEPHVAALPAQAPAFFVPTRRELAATMTPGELAQLHLPARKVTLGTWQECSARRDSTTWAKGRVGCVALAVIGLETARPDAMTFALLALTPARGLSWPRVRVLRPREAWVGRILSNAGE